VLGNYGLSLQLTGELDVIAILNESGAPAAIFATLDTLPLGPIVIGVFTLLCIIFTATSFDSISYILASVVQNDVTEEPMRWNRLFWAFTLSFLPTVLMFMGGLSTLQTAAIVGGLPLLVISVMLMVSFVRAASLDIKHQAEYEEPTINIEELPEIDPWSTEGMALAKFERFKDLAQQAAEEEREAMAALMSMRKRIRAFALEHSCESGFSDHHLPEDMQTELQQLTEALELAQQKKQELSE
ncbi:BCCT family transporter, partial [Vibrio diabolicus]|nr:BCCT family transporter [Vibrio diabolicus]